MKRVCKCFLFIHGLCPFFFLFLWSRFNHVMRVNAVNAVETLLVTDELFRCVQGNLDNESGTHVHTHTHPQYTVQYTSACVWCTGCKTFARDSSMWTLWRVSGTTQEMLGEKHSDGTYCFICTYISTVHTYVHTHVRTMRCNQS